MRATLYELKKKLNKKEEGECNQDTLIHLSTEYKAENRYS